jgi:tryptophan synthase beta chain
MANERAYFGNFGGQFVPELLMPAMEEVEKAFEKCYNDRRFRKRLDYYLKEYAGRPTPLYYAERFSEEVGLKVYLKREDLLHTGAHKLNNTLGQAMLTKEMGKKRVICETAAGQHGVAVATAANVFGLETAIFIGTKDIKRSYPNVQKFKLLGADIIPVEGGEGKGGILKDATNEALRHWITRLQDTHYLIGSAVGPHPFPKIVRSFQSVIGDEIKKQFVEKERGLPDAIIACGSGGSNALGAFYAFLDDESVDLYFVEAGGAGIGSDTCAAPIQLGDKGVLHGAYAFLMQDEFGQVKPSKSRSAGLNYPGRGPEISHLAETGRAKAVYALDEDVFEAFKVMTTLEGLPPALETAHAVAFLMRNADEFDSSDVVVINYSGRGDKDMHTVIDYLGVKV